MSFKRDRGDYKGRIDWFTIILYLLLVVAGWFAVCGASYDFDISHLFMMGGRPMMQLLWIGLAVVIGFMVLLMETDIFESLAPVFYAAMLGLLALTILIAPDIKGSHSWLVVGPLRLQPAEFAKVTTALFLAWKLNQNDFVLRGMKAYASTFAIILIPVLLILMQNETGSALVYIAFFLALYREGMSGVFIGIAFCAVLFFVTALKLQGDVWWGHTDAAEWSVVSMAFVIGFFLVRIYTKERGRFYVVAAGLTAVTYAVAIVLSYFVSVDFVLVAYGLLAALIVWALSMAIKRYVLSYALIAVFALCSVGYFYSVDYVFNKVMQPHQQMRIRVALGIEDDLRGGGYNVDQSKIAIGSGGFMGKGFLKGTQTKLKYVPEQDTDFIFCTVGEEQGFLGSVLLLIGYATLIIRIVALAERQTKVFSRVYGHSVAAILLFHLSINVGMVIGLVPVIGIPLPFFSYGGSSLWGFTLLIFIFLRLDADRDCR